MGQSIDTPRSALPPAEVEQVLELLEERWADGLADDDDLRLHGEVVGDRLFVTLELRNATREEDLTLQTQVLVSELPSGEAARHLAYDVLDALLGEHLEADRLAFFPGEWSLTEYGGHELAYRCRRRRTGLEAQADALLNDEQEHDDI